jgi:hypothetical protein
MGDGAPVTFWAILQWDPKIGEKRVCGIYDDPRAAQEDASAMQGGGTFVEVEPWEIFTAARYSDGGEPAWEADDEDFDVPVGA